LCPGLFIRLVDHAFFSTKDEAGGSVGDNKNYKNLTL
jgi:hypothetical protein